MTRMTKGFGSRKFLALVAGAALASALTSDLALAQSAECVRLQQAIAAASRNGPGAQAQAQVERQRAELSRTTAYARSLGCENRKFLIFGSDPPAQCGELNAQISRMQANLADLQGRAGGGAGGRGELIARFNAQCANGPARGGGNFFTALFGGGLFGGGKPSMEPMEPLSPDEAPPGQEGEPIDRSGVNARAGSYAVCVRTCDGSFFPVSYSGAGSRADSLEEVCRALCPNADVELYSFPFGGTINEAVSATGEPYVNLPNALKYTQTYDASCSCRRRGQSWAEALAGAEARYGHQSHDILVTPEKSAEMARAIPDAKKPAVDPKAKLAKASASGAAPPTAQAVDSPTPVLDANGTDTALSAAAAAVSRETTAIAGGEAKGGANYGRSQGKTVEEKGPDGVTRRVRIVGQGL